MKTKPLFMRIIAIVLSILLLCTAPLLFLCVEGWWRRLGVIPIIWFAMVFLTYAFKRKY